jgi:hypothetical protein
MAKAATPKKTVKPSKKKQYERFQKTARDLGIDNEKGAQTFERAFERIVPPKRPSSSASLGEGCPQRDDE